VVVKAYENEVWVIPTGVFQATKVADLYAKIGDALRKELEDRGANVFDHLLAERLVFSYCLVRDKDAKAGYTKAWANDKVRRDTLQDFIGAVENVQRRWIREDWQDAEETVKRKLAGALNEALLDVDPSLSGMLRQRLSEELAKAGL
jgi:uncharacterized membrane-anchored protein YjiN (DUF445 family)